MDELPPTFELLEPASPEALLPGPWLEPWMIILLVLLVVSLIALLVMKKRQIVAVSAEAERSAAFEQANAELTTIQPPHARAAATQASLILRRYLSVAARDPALFETHEEFVSRSDSLKPLTPEARAASEVGFAALAAMKYAPEIPSADPAAVVAEARKLLDTLHQGFAS
jgi:hypothetical protein